MDDIKRKVYLDLFASPSTLLPIAGGLTALLFSWAVGGNAPLTFGGLVGILGGAGLFASRLIFGLEKITNDAYQYVVAKKQKSQVESLQLLHAKLVRDGDARTEQLLARLWQLYRELENDIKSGKVAYGAHEVLEGVDRLFHVCVDNLDQSIQLWERAQKLKGKSGRGLLKQRDDIVAEVQASVTYLEEKVEQLHSSKTSQKKSELSQLRKELDEALRVAKRAEEETESLGGSRKSYKESDFE